MGLGSVVPGGGPESLTQKNGGTVPNQAGDTVLILTNTGTSAWKYSSSLEFRFGCTKMESHMETIPPGVTAV